MRMTSSIRLPNQFQVQQPFKLISTIPCYVVASKALIARGKRSRKEIRRFAEGNIRIILRMVDSVDRDWVEAISYFIERKTSKINQPGLIKYPIDWLLIYDNGSPASVLKEHDATACPIGKSTAPKGRIPLTEFSFSVFAISGNSIIAKVPQLTGFQTGWISLKCNQRADVLSANNKSGSESGQSFNANPNIASFR